MKLSDTDKFRYVVQRESDGKYRLAENGWTANLEEATKFLYLDSVKNLIGLMKGDDEYKYLILKNGKPYEPRDCEGVQSTGRTHRERNQTVGTVERKRNKRRATGGRKNSRKASTPSKQLGLF